MDAAKLKKRKIALLKLGEAMAACEDAGVCVGGLGNGGPVSMTIYTPGEDGAPWEWLYDSDDHDHEPNLTFAGVLLALEKIGVTI